MEGWCTVEQHRVLANHLLQGVPNLWGLEFDELFGHLDGRCQLALLELLIDKGLKELEGHLLGQPALMELELGADHDDRTTGVVDPLTEQVLPETALFALEVVGQRFERPVVGALDDPSPSAVVEERVNRFLEHPFLVTDDDLGRAEVEELLEPIVAVDHPAIEIVEIRGGKASAVQRHQRPKLGRQDRDDLEDHPLGSVAGATQGFDQLEPFGRLLTTHDGGLGTHDHPQLGRHVVEIQNLEKRSDGLGAHLGNKCLAELFLGPAVVFLGEDLLFLEGGVTRIDHDISLEVEHSLELAHGQVEQKTDTRR